MRFLVAKSCSGGSGRARVGTLYPGGVCGSGEGIETPALVLSTRRGLPAFLPRDLLASIPSPDSHLLHLSPIHFLECPSPKTISSIGGSHKMLGVPDHVFIAAPRDSIECLPESQGTNKLGACFETPCGRRLVSPANYMDMISSLKPNLWASLADEVPAWVSEKRNKLSVDRTLRWLDDCLALDSENGSTVLGAIVGGSNVEDRKRCATEVARRNVSGFWIGGFGLGDSMEERPPLLSAVVDCLPMEKLRQISGLSLPEEVLQGVAAGIDLFDSTYIYHLTIGGFALVFPLEYLERNTLDVHLTYAGGDYTKINLRATMFRKDVSSIVEGCRCFTCENHTRAYINHLLNVHEMLAHILLEIHNTHHYLGFFGAIREAIKSGNFELFHERFIKDRRAYLTSAALLT